MCSEEKLPSVSSINRIVRSNKRYDDDDDEDYDLNTDENQSDESTSMMGGHHQASSTSINNNNKQHFDRKQEPQTSENYGDSEENFYNELDDDENTNSNDSETHHQLSFTQSPLNLHSLINTQSSSKKQHKSKASSNITDNVYATNDDHNNNNDSENYMIDTNSQTSNQSSGNNIKTSSKLSHSKQQQQRHKGNCVCITCINKYKYLTATGQLVGQQQTASQHNILVTGQQSYSPSSSIDLKPPTVSATSLISPPAPAPPPLPSSQSATTKRKIDKLAESLAQKKQKPMHVKSEPTTTTNRFDIKNLLDNGNKSTNVNTERANQILLPNNNLAQQLQLTNLFNSQALLANLFPSNPVGLLSLLQQQQQQQQLSNNSLAGGLANAALLANPSLLAMAMAAAVAKAQPGGLSNNKK